MSRYFFHVNDGTDMPDEIGTELLDDEAARATAITVSGELLKDLGSTFWTGSDWKLRVITEDGQTVCELTFSAKT